MYLLYLFIDVPQTSSTSTGQKKIWKPAKLITSTAPSYPDNGTKYEEKNAKKRGK